MKNLLNQILELQSKYVELPEYKKNSCLPIKQLLPKLKISKEEVEDGLSDHKQELIRNRKKKKRKFKNSFFHAENMVQWTQEELENQDPKNRYAETQLQYYEDRDKKN